MPRLKRDNQTDPNIGCSDPAGMLDARSDVKRVSLNVIIFHHIISNEMKMGIN